MNEELKAKLKAALQNAGLSEGLLANLTVTEEGQIQGVVDNLKLLATRTPLTEEELSKNPLVQKIADRRVTDALKKAKQPETDTPPEPNGQLTAEAIAAIIAKAQEPLQQQLETLTGQRTLESKRNDAATLIATSKLSDLGKKRAPGRLNFESEKTVNEQLMALETEEAETLQFLADTGKLATAPPSIGGAGEMTDADAQAIADRQRV